MQTTSRSKLARTPSRRRHRPLCQARLGAPILFAILTVFASPACAQQKSAELANQSLEDLMNVEVTSVSKKEQKLSRTASAIFLITQEDIRRSGATNIPDLLRIVPGVAVAQISANAWAISIRGFTDQFSDKLLVMLDGRTVYTPSFGGVFWDTLDVPMEDIDRIEVIRGPGGTIWGANAVNGVISIMTKKAADTQGGMISAIGGSLEQGTGTTQYGMKWGEKTQARFWAKYFNDASLPNVVGPGAVDGWHVLRGGFRADSTFSASDELSVLGDLYTGREGQSVNVLPSVTAPVRQVENLEVNLSGGFLQSAWNHTFSPRSDTTVQVSFDRYNRTDLLDELRDTFNIDFQHHLAVGTRHDLIWGIGYRYTTSDTAGSLTISFNPAKKAEQLFNSFIQDEIALQPERLYLTVGTKLEHNDFSGIDVLPSVRLSWSATPHQMFWGAVSRAVNTPEDTDTLIRVNIMGIPGPGGPPSLVALAGNPNFENEFLTAYEAGYRAQISTRVSLDLAGFFNSYDHMQTIEPGIPFFETSPAPAHEVIPQTYRNLMHGETHGIEVAANWKVSNRWTLSPGYAFENVHLHLSPTSEDTSSVKEDEGSSPVHSAQLRSSLSLTHGLQWNAAAYFVDRLPAETTPAYTRLDSGLEWQAAEKLTISLVGQNLLRDHCLEFRNDQGYSNPSYVKRSAYAKFTWQF